MDSSLTPLLASILALFVGPVIHSRLRTAAAAAAVDAFALVSVAGLVLAHILPQSFQIAGWWVLPVALLGLFGPGLLCGSRVFAGQSSRRITMPLAIVGIALHALFDGVAVTSSAMHGHGEHLSWAVVLHRLPVGLGIWWLARPAYGRRTAAGLLAAIAGFSVVGFLLGDLLLEELTGSGFALFQALVAGSLLHVILRHPPAVRGAAPTSEGLRRAASGLGGLLGVALIIGLERVDLEHQGAHAGHGEASGFMELALQSAPALLVAYLAIALLHASAFDLRRLFGRGGALSQAVRGTAAGLPVPICSCGVIPLYRSLVVSGVSTPAAMSFLIATPELSFAALLLSWSLLGGEITLVRAACAAALALIVGFLVGSRAPRDSAIAESAPAPDAREPLGQRLRRGLSYGFGDMVDGTAPWILAGLGLAAFLGPVLQLEELRSLPAGWEVPIFALAGLPLYVCASGSTPLAAVLIAKGVAPGAAIAFLLTGPATNLTTFGVLARLHSRATAIAFGIVTVAFTVALGWSVNGLLSSAAAGVPDRLHADHGGLELASLVALSVLFGVSLLRQGTRGFLAQVTSPYAEGHEHDHDHDHGHEHGHVNAVSSCCDA